MYRVSSIATQSSAACLAEAVTMIMSQQIILSLHDWRTSLEGASSIGVHPGHYELSTGTKGARPKNAYEFGGKTDGSGTGSTAGIMSVGISPTPTASTSNSPTVLKYGHTAPWSHEGWQEPVANMVDLSVDKTKEDYDYVSERTRTSYLEIPMSFSHGLTVKKALS
jgi:hypothetical protein